MTTDAVLPENDTGSAGLLQWWTAASSLHHSQLAALTPAEPLPHHLAQSMAAAGVELTMVLIDVEGRTTRRYAQPHGLRELLALSTTS